MSAEFVSLAELLRAAATESLVREAASGVSENGGADSGTATSAQGGPAARNRHITSVADVESFDRVASFEDVPPLDEAGVMAGALRDARLFRARLADAFDDAAARLVRELAADVLARELRLAPAEIGVLVHRVLERAPVIRVRVAPADVGFIRGVPVLADPALDPGDAVVELGRGEFDMRLGVRLAAVLEAFA